MEPPIAEPPAPTASPFNPAARPPAKGGCPKPLILGCLGVLVLAGLCLVGFFFYAGTHVGQLFQLSLSQSESGIFAQMPKDVPQPDQQRLHAAFAAARARAARPGNVQESAEAMQQINFKMLQAIRKGGAMTRKDVGELSGILEEFAKTGSPPEAK